MHLWYYSIFRDISSPLNDFSTFLLCNHPRRKFHFPSLYRKAISSESISVPDQPKLNCTDIVYLHSVLKKRTTVSLEKFDQIFSKQGFMVGIRNKILILLVFCGSKSLKKISNCEVVIKFVCMGNINYMGLVRLA